jgi:hypothetical protein
MSLRYPAGGTPTVIAAVLAISDQAATLSLVGQLASMAVAALIGRFVMKSRPMIWIICFLGAFGAMCAHIAVDGQGAFILLIYTPLIYAAAVVGRNDLPGPQKRTRWR